MDEPIQLKTVELVEQPAIPSKQTTSARKDAASSGKPIASGRTPAASARKPKAKAAPRKPSAADPRQSAAGGPKSTSSRSKQAAKFVVSHGLADKEIGLFDDDAARKSEEAARFGGRPDATRINQSIIDAIDSAPVELTIAPNVVESETKFAATNADQAGGIEILIKLATSGEIDPKNIDIIDVTDKFLKAIAAVPKENLRQSGKILFHASVLLRMKAEAMLAAAVAVDVADDFIDFDEDDGSISSDLSEPRQLTLLDLERALVRKANNRQNRQRKVTLDQLIDALREAEKIEKTRQAREPRQRIELAGQHEANDVGDLLDLAHDEDIEDTISRVEQILASAIGEGELVQLLRIIQLLGGHGDWVDAFLAVLFLSNAGKLTLEQKDFYGPLFVVRGDAAVESINVAM
ncbi:MAG: segregation/condensation protein A [Cyanobacteria bacterium SZAS-4]|nr:segregation/condensation protein A [Cyanobacteria bacterium SZAS-4]